MSIFDKLAGRLGYVKQAQSDKDPKYLIASQQLEKSVMDTGRMWESQAELYMRLSWLQASVSWAAETAASTPFRVKEIQGEHLLDIDNHPLERLMDFPNEDWAGDEFLIHTISDYSITGNAYWHVIRFPDEPHGEPIELWPIPSYRIKPALNGKIGLSHYEYDPGTGQEIILPKHQVIHFRKYHPKSMYVGLSGIEALATVATGDIKMQEWIRNFFSKNNAKIEGILAFAEMVNDGDWEMIKKKMREDWGDSRRGGPLLMRGTGEGAINWVSTMFSQKDMEFLAGRQFNKEEIFTMFAPGLASVLDVNATEANAKAGKATLKDKTHSILNMMGKKITHSLLPAYGGNLVAKFDEIREIDRLMKLREDREYGRTHTIDEIRWEKYQDKPIGDERGDLLPDQITETFMDRDVDQEQGAARTGATERQVNAKYGKELEAWENFEKKRVGKKNSRNFVCQDIPKSLEGAIRGALKHVDTEEGIKEVFNTAMAWEGYP